MVRRQVPWSLFLALAAACGEPGGDAADAAVAAPDAAPGADAAAVPLAGFGAISGACGVLGEPELTGAAPALFTGELDFADDPFDDPADRDRLTAGGLEILLDDNAGGSSLLSEVFAFELLARCELAELRKTETEIVYDVAGSKRTDLLVDLHGHPIGVSVTRAVTFPFGEPYQPAAAADLLAGKLADIQAASAAVSEADRWDKQILAVLAYDAQHAEVAAQAWAGIDAAIRADTVVVITVTSGADLFIYTDQTAR